MAQHGQGHNITIKANKVLEDAQLGDSICTNGVCLTVEAMTATSFTASVMPETLNTTNLGTLRPGMEVNLERALAVGKRLGGHIVSGHIDGTGVIRQKMQDRTAVRLTIACNRQILALVVAKGSIAIDGVSLTVTHVERDAFGVSLVEHTQGNTTLTAKRVGDTVNLENDMLGKYVQRLMSTNISDEKKLSLEDLL